jgi:hypothetical protein
MQTIVNTKDSTLHVTRAENGAVLEVQDLGLARQAKVRRIEDPAHILQVARKWAREKGAPEIRSEHAGMVANAYGYPASTEAVIVVAWPDGRAWLKLRRIDGKKHTKTWHIRALTGVDGYMDARRKPENQAAAEAAIIAYAAEQLREAEQLA